MSRALFILIALVLTLSACTKEPVSQPGLAQRGPGDGEGILGIEPFAFKIDFSYVGQVAEQIFKYTNDPEALYYVTVKYTPAGVALTPKREPKNAFTDPITFANGMTMTRIATKELLLVTPNASVANSPTPVVECVISGTNPNWITLSVWRIPGTQGAPATYRIDGISYRSPNHNDPYPSVPYGVATPNGPGGPGSGGVGTYNFGIAGPSNLQVDEGGGCILNGFLEFEPGNSAYITYTHAVGTTVH